MTFEKLYRIKRLTSPATEPVTLEEAKSNLRVQHTAEDAFITSLIPVARLQAEKYCNRLFADATARIIFNDFPDTLDDPIYIPMDDISSIDAVKYIDEDNAEQEITDSEYTATTQLLYPAESWPSGNVRSVFIDISAGDPVDIEAAKQAILLFITDLYENRGNMSARQLYNNQAAIHLLQPYRVDMGL